MSNIILFHESKEVVKTPEIRAAKYNKDFYFGFYCTLLENQAARWATRFTGHGIINKYQYSESSDLNIRFNFEFCKFTVIAVLDTAIFA